MIVTEAWLAGCAVVATPVGLIPELEEKHGELTYQVPVNPTNEDLALAVEAAVVDTSSIQSWAREVAWQLFSPFRMMREFERVLRNSINEESETR